MEGMGTIHVEATVSSERGSSETVSFLVDSGAIYSVLPKPVWTALGLTPKRTLDFSLVDGTIVRRTVSECRFAYAGLDAASPVILGEEGDAALLGAVTLETLGLVLDPFARIVRPMHLRLGRVALADAASSP